MRQGRWIAGALLGMGAGLCVTGCFSGGVYQVPGDESLAADLTAQGAPRVARAQQVDLSDPRFRPQLATPTLLPPAPPPVGRI